MLDLIDLSQAGILCGLLSIYVLLFKKNALRSYSDYLLSTFIFFQCWAAIAYILVFTGGILEAPFIFKTAAPINLLIPPLGYLYVRSVLYNEKRLVLRDLWHILPFAFFFISYLPFFLAPSEFKMKIILAVLQDKNVLLDRQLGWLPEGYFHTIRLGQDVVYLILQWMLVLNYSKKNTDSAIETQIHQVLRWLKVFTAANTLILIAFLGAAALIMFKYDIFEEQVSLLPNSVLGLSFFLICAYLLIHPQVLVGLPFVRKAKMTQDTVGQDTEKNSFCVESYAQEIALLDHYFVTSKAYLQPNLAISEVSVATGIPTRDLSYLINAYHKKRFSDYLNQMRLVHFLTQVDASSLDNLTIEAVALASGFSSKTSFYRAFNRFYGCTPSDYLRGMDAKE
jgi:AraC-like DNA-binding protein